MSKYIRIVAVILFLSLSAFAKVRDDRFAANMNLDGFELQRVGTGVLSRWFIKGCDMALFVIQDTTKASLLDDRPRVLEFYYYTKIRGDQFATAAWDTLEKNWSKSELEQQRSNIDKLHGFYRDVKKGDRYRLIYLPGKGTSLYLNEKLMGTVAGKEFSKMYFSVWLGDIPISGKLKKGLTSGLK